MVAGGEALCRTDDGRVLFVRGALPGETVTTGPRRRGGGADHATCAEVLVPSPERREPPCPAVARGCGGCDWQHLTRDAQVRHKQAVVADALRRIAGVDDLSVTASPGRDPGLRTWLRLAVHDGVPGHRLRRSHDVDRWTGCLVAHPTLEHIAAEARFPHADEVTLRVGATTGDALAYATPTARNAAVPDGVRVVGADDLDGGKRAWIHDEFCGRRWRISARSFQQPGPAAAEMLVDAVAAACTDLPVDSGRATVAVDAYGGIGLFAGALHTAGVPGNADWHVVELSPDAAADARVNLRDTGARVHQVAFDAWRGVPADLVVADPPRAGCGRPGVARIARTGAARVVLVSCDPASLARDTALLHARGYRAVHCAVVDAFPETSHVETVTRFDRR
jgi:23S rRNA (uracil1939-C5)-methyltransferase